LSGIRGITAAFEDRDEMLDALRRLRYAGFTRIEVYSPEPVEEADAILGHRVVWLPLVIFAAAVAGAAGGFLLQWYGSVHGYPVNVGGRPLNSWPAFGTTTFELMVLAAVLVGTAALLAFCRLPRLYDPVFGAPGLDRATRDRYVIRVEARDRYFDRDRLYRRFRRYERVEIADVPA
jgi:hypothetical protein